MCATAGQHEHRPCPGARTPSRRTAARVQGGYFGGDIAEMLVYDTLLTDEQASNLLTRLKEKWSIDHF